MFGSTSGRERPQRGSDGEWWVLLVTEGLTIDYVPELYRDHERAQCEAERWARTLARRSHAQIERPFQDRWHVGDEWIRVTHSFLGESDDDVWVGTYWTRHGSPDPEAELFSDATEARGWVMEAPAGAILIESHEAPGSFVADYRVRGGEEKAEAHRGKIVGALLGSLDDDASDQIVYGFEVMEGFIPQVPGLFSTERIRDSALRRYLEEELRTRRWRDFVAATATANYVEQYLPTGWEQAWNSGEALEWLLGFDFMTDGDDLEIRRFTAETHMS